MTRRKFKVGDKVVTKCDTLFCNKGDVGEVTSYFNRYYTVKFKNGFRIGLKGVELDAYVEEPKKVEKPKKLAPREKTRKFEVGDIVKGTSDYRYAITNCKMTKGVVTETDDYGLITVRVLEHKEPKWIGNEYRWVKSEYFEKIEEPKNTIVIYQRNRDVVAFDKTTGQKCYAHCHPDDEFDFKTGAAIAFDRLMGRVEPVKEEIKYLDRFEHGKTYIFDKEIFYSMGGYHKYHWVEQCDGKVVEIGSDYHGNIEVFAICPEWCKEVKDPTLTIKKGNLVEVTKDTLLGELKGARGIVRDIVEIFGTTIVTVEIKSNSVSAEMLFSPKELKKVD